jgi:hypothetical protein
MQSAKVREQACHLIIIFPQWLTISKDGKLVNIILLCFCAKMAAMVKKVAAGQLT